MRDSDMPEFLRILTDPCNVHEKSLTESLIRYYQKGLQSYDIKTIAYGFDLHAQDPVNGRFMPLPAHIILQIDKHAPDLVMIENKGGLAWCKNTQKLLDTYLKQGREL
jgi:hypothetical protein